MSGRTQRYQASLLDFMQSHVYPVEKVYDGQMRESGDPHFQPPILEELKAQARERGLWNLFHPHPEWGPGLTNLEYAPLAEIMGRSPIAPEACNCNAPDTGNMEVLTLFGTAEHKEKYLKPLLAGSMASAFAMTEPQVASSDATNIELRMERDGDEYLLNGRKWFASNALHRHCKVMIVMGKTDPAAAPHRQQSMMVVPIDAPGVTVVRGLPVFGYNDREGHAEIEFRNVRVPSKDVLKGEGEGFAISQARLGPGRIHHCMRTIGMAERALELMCRRAQSRTAFGKPLSANANIQDWIAEARIDIEMIRLLTFKAAHLMDTVGNKRARTEIAAIKVAAPTIALRIVDRAIQVHGGAGVTDDFPLAAAWAHLRTLRLADGPDEVHKRSIARHELGKYREPARCLRLRGLARQAQRVDPYPGQGFHQLVKVVVLAQHVGRVRRARHHVAEGCRGELRVQCGVRQAAELELVNGLRVSAAECLRAPMPKLAEALVYRGDLLEQRHQPSVPLEGLQVGAVTRLDDRGGVVVAGQVSDVGVQHLVLHLLEHGGEDLLFAGEVRVEGARRGACLGGDVRQPGVQVALSLEYPAGCLDQLCARAHTARGARHLAASGRARGRRSALPGAGGPTCWTSLHGVRHRRTGAESPSCRPAARRRRSPASRR
jgi:acyl-CoA dehydrogenase